MNTVRLKKRIPMPTALREALDRHPEAADLLRELGKRGIFVHLDERGRAFWAATKDILITIAQIRAFNEQKVQLTEICDAGNLRRQSIGAAS